MKAISVYEKDIKKIYDAFRSLYDLQNGAPLEKYKREWEKTMRYSKDSLIFLENLMETSNEKEK